DGRASDTKGLLAKIRSHSIENRYKPGDKLNLVALTIFARNDSLVAAGGQSGSRVFARHLTVIANKSRT
ncbi:MAG: hypothetical protein ACKV2V_27130, partial [Blastocatellia bacterium]